MAKFTPSAPGVAPSGNGEPGSTVFVVRCSRLMLPAGTWIAFEAIASPPFFTPREPSAAAPAYAIVPDVDFPCGRRSRSATAVVGDTREEVEALILEAIEFHLEGMREEGLPIPAPKLDRKNVVHRNGVDMR